MKRKRAVDIVVSGKWNDQRFCCGTAEARVFFSSGGWSVHTWIGLREISRSRHDSRVYAVRKARAFVRDNRNR